MRTAVGPTGERGASRPDTARAARDAAGGRRLLRAAQAGDRTARDRLVRAHLRAVRPIAAAYQDLGLPFDDLLQEGAVGLLEAIDHYDPRRGASFESYVRFRIRRAIRNALTEKARLVRLPKQIVERRRALEQAEGELIAAADGRVPTAEELAAATGLPVAAVRRARAALLAPVSLDEPLLHDGTPLADAVADRSAVNPEARALEHEQTALLSDALTRLPERERQIVAWRYGVGTDSATNADVARRLHLSPRRTETIQRDALYRLRRELDPR